MNIPLGPFDLIASAGRGAMAEVWRAVHRRQGVSVAVKVVTAPAGREARFRRLFAREIRAVARLDHPSVVPLFDHGELPAHFVDLAEPRLPAGAPYLVMAWLGGGSLRSRAPMPWPVLRSTLLGLLDGLAHAHARGVIHRDLKIDNVLFGDGGPVLTDFGLAFDIEDSFRPSEGRRRLMGTPNYMAPEQIDTDDRALGPWTDLYAVGCLAWCLATGRPPFDRPSPMAVLQAHIDEKPPALRTAHPLPLAFEAWVRRLLAKAPGRRFRFAADAAVALMDIPEQISGATTRIQHRALVADAPSESDLTLVAPPTFVSITDPGWRAARGDDRPAMPASWRGPERAEPPPVLLGTGQALFGLRTLTLHGRTAERDRLWTLLRGVVDGAGAAAVIIEGPSGHGKSRLAEWLGQRAHELGIADTLRATHDLPRGPGCGLGPMLARHLRCEALDAAARLARIAQHIDDDATARALAAMLDPDGRILLGGRALAVQAEVERREAICRALAHIARRPLIVQLDDVQWAEDALRFVEHLLEHHPELPVLVLLTARDDGRRPTRALLDGLVARGAHRIGLGPLDPAAHRALLAATLPLDDGVLDRLVARAGGSPIFAEQVIRHWLSTDALDSGRRGFRLKAGADARPPPDLPGLWASRITEALEPAEPDASAAFELAAALGQGFALDEWAAVCAAAGLSLPSRGIERMLDARLIDSAPDGFAFTHAMLREDLQLQADLAGRRPRWNRICARVLAAGDVDPVRLADHLEAAGDVDAALEPLARAMRDRRRRSDFPAVRRLLERRVRLLRGQRHHPTDRRWVETRVFAARLAVAEQDFPRARRWASRAVRTGEDTGELDLLAEALITRGDARLKTTDGSDAALDDLERAQIIAESIGDPQRAAEALIKRGTALLVVGRTAEAQAAFAAGHARLTALDAPDDELMGELLRKMTDTARRIGDLDAAWAHGQRAYAHYERIGARWPMARVSNTLGDILRYRGDLAGAVKRYEELRQLSEELGLTLGTRYAETNLGLVLIELCRYAEARPLLQQALAAMRAMDDAEMVAYVNAALWPCDAARGNWTAWDARRAALGPLFECKYHDPDAAMAASHAARLAQRAGRPRRAADALALAVAQYRALERAADADALVEELGIEPAPL